VIVAPGRARRPGARLEAPVDEPSAYEPSCPFCESNEARTPPEPYAVAAGPRDPDTTGWTVRVVPNLDPAVAGDLGRQEVAIHAPRHLTSLADLTEPELAAAAEAWRARAREARERGFDYLYTLVNEGRVAGSSLPHGHSQLVWLPSPPPAIEAELAAAANGCALCTLLAAERAEGARVVWDDGGLVALCPPAGRAPYELLIAPAACERDAYASELLTAAVERAAALVRRLHALEGRAPLNLWVHSSPLGGGSLHWHVELVPRLTVLAGLELGAGLYVNQLAPEDAAAALRGDI
jgi:UDPglucose--hexose-1-phosphate uridylyltransferase